MEKGTHIPYRIFHADRFERIPLARRTSLILLSRSADPDRLLSVPVNSEGCDSRHGGSA
jgi:hypothetical protein